MYDNLQYALDLQLEEVLNENYSKDVFQILRLKTTSAIRNANEK